MNAEAKGFLVVLSDVKAKDEREYLAWLTSEHVQERLEIPGFLAVRIFRKAIAGGHQYFIWYALESADVVDCAAYLERLNNPTPWSRRIMPILHNFGRGGGHVTRSKVSGRGDRILVSAFDEFSQSIMNYSASLEAVSGIRAVHLLMTDKTKSAVRTSERDLRSSDSSFGGLLIAELSQDSVEPKAKQIPQDLERSSIVNGQYHEVFSLTA